MAIPTDLYEAARSTAPRLQKFRYVTWPHREPLHHQHAALDDLVPRRLQQRLPADRRRTGRQDPRAGDARHPLRLQPCTRSAPASPRDRGAAARLVPLSSSWSAASAGRVERMSAAAISRREHAVRSYRGHERPVRARPVLLGVVVLIWTLVPIYHMVDALAHAGERRASRGRSGPTTRRSRTTASCSRRITSSCRTSGASSATACSSRSRPCARAAIASLASFAIGRLKLRFGHVRLERCAPDLPDPGGLPRHPVLPDDGRLRPAQHALGADLRDGDLRHPYAIWVLRSTPTAPVRARRGGQGRRRHAAADLPPGLPAAAARRR